MKDISLDLGGFSNEFCESVGNFIRSTYYNQCKVFSIAGIGGSVTCNNNIQNLSMNATLPGALTVNDIAIAFRKSQIDISDYLHLKVMESEQVKDVSPVVKSLNVVRLSSEVFLLTIETAGNSFKANDMGSIAKGESTILDLWDDTVVEAKFELYLYYGNGKFNITQVTSMLKSYGADVIALPFSAVPKGNVGIEVKDVQSRKNLLIKYDERRVNPDDILREIQSGLTMLTEAVGHAIM